jgi:hypothetical protein
MGENRVGGSRCTVLRYYLYLQLSEQHACQVLTTSQYLVLCSAEA